jgi:DEP domain-containing protein 5
VEVDYIEMAFKDIYLDRADMWRLARSLRDTTIYVGKRITYSGSIRTTVKSIYVHSSTGRPSRNATSGWVTARTRPIFRSESSRFLLMVQMSAELWEFEEDGELMYHKCVDGYLPQLFEKWRLTGARHLVTIVLFARVYKDREDVMYDEDAKPYEDYFKTVVDNTASSEWAETLLQLKKEFLKIQKELLVQHRPSSATSANSKEFDGVDVISGTLSTASQGNVLEAVSLASQQFANNYIDPDLLRTGLSVIIITPGTGVFEVEKSILERTTEELMKLGVGIDLVCLGRMPLHSVPLFRYRDNVPEHELELHPHLVHRDRDSRGSRSTSFSTDSNNLFSDWKFALPHWLDVSYWEQSMDYRRGGKRQWRPRCRMHELQMMGVMEQEMSSFSIPLLTARENTEEGWEEYDAKVFEKPKRGEAEMMLFSPGRRESRLSPPKRSELRRLAAAAELRDISAASKSEKRLSTGRLDGLFAGKRKDSDTTKFRAEASTATSTTTSASGLPSEAAQAITTTSTRPDGTTHTITRGFEIRPPTLPSPPQRTASLGASKAQPASPRTTTVSPAHVLSPKAAAVLPASITAPSPSLSMPHQRTRRQSTIAKEEAAQPFVLKPPTSPPPWQIIPNPSNPKTTITQDSSQYRRWQHVTPRPTSVSHMKWKSMRTPAALPLQSAYFPKEEELRDEYEQHTYTMAVNPEEVGISLRSLMEEMIAQRLAQGYQIVVRQGQGEGNAPIPSASAAFRMDFVAPQITKGVLEGPLADIPDMVYVTLGGKQIHRLELRRDFISVARYVRRTSMNPVEAQKPIPYQCQMWGNFQEGYRTVNLQLQQSLVTDTINWNYMDLLLSGWESQFKDSVRHKRARWVLIPTDVRPPEPGLDKEEMHIAGIQKLNEMFQRMKWKAPDEPTVRRKDMAIPDIVFCTESVAAYIAKELDALVDLKDHASESRILQIGKERFSKSSIKISTLAEEMQAAPPAGVPRANRRWHLKYYDDVFIGSQFVTWLVTNFEDIRTREEGVMYGEELMSKGLFEHCKGAHEFMDGHYFYRVSPLYAQSTPQNHQKERRSWLGTVMNRTSPTVTPTVPSISGEFTGRSRGDSSASQNLPPPMSQPPRQRIVLSSCIKLDVDTRKESSRPEIALLHYDRIHNATACYHIRIEWLTATTRFIHQLLRNVSHIAWRYGLRLVEVPIDEISNVTNSNPFREPLEISLAKEPPASPHANEPFHYHEQLLKKFDFVVDTEAGHLFPSANVDVLQSWGQKPNYASTQYIHRTGLAFVQISSRGTFLWLSNRMYVSRTETAVNPPPLGADPDKLRNDFKEFCGGERKLEKWFTELNDVPSSVGRRASLIGIPNNNEDKKK